MPKCPKGHDSVAADYCDECGAPIGGQQAVPVSVSLASTGPPASTGPAPAAVQECPSCGAPRAGRFCEVCGHDFVLGTNETTALRAASTAAESTAAESTLVPATGGPATTSTAAATSTASASATSTAPTTSTAPATSSGLPHRAGAPPGWRVVVSADPEYHARMQQAAVPEAPPIPFPAYCPERRFPLGTTQQLIGRRRPSRGIEPDIDLTGPPEDPAVSHAHALLVPGPNGGWSVVDLDSANGTYLNGSTEPIEPHVPVPLHDGDRIHVGAWTTLTVQREEAA